jgi:signal-transduction protein with cAMP-binding, CBS, and nucleotidyltransferase domain
MYLSGGKKSLELRVNWQLTCFLILIMVEQLVSEQLSTQDPRGGLCLFLVSKQNLNPPIGASGALKIVKNRLELKKKVMAPQSRGCQELIITNRQKSLNTQKIPCMLLYPY